MKSNQMTDLLKTIRNYCCYCGIEKEEYNAVKKDAYISNFKVWKILSILMTVVFGGLLISSLLSNMMSINKIFYLVAFVYSIVATTLFFILKKDSIVAQLLIYLSISLLFLFACFITQNKPEIPATMFVILLVITPMFMIDKPYFMTLELCAASAVFLVWMYFVKSYEIWQYDLINVIIYTLVGIFLHIIANSIRIKEFVLRRELNIQKDIDDLTGLKNKGAITRAINSFLANESTNKGIMFLLDIDKFKDVNDMYGHDVGDAVIKKLGTFLDDKFTNDEIVGRWGGDEFIVFFKNTDDIDNACEIADSITKEAKQEVIVPNSGEGIAVSIGIDVYTGDERNYSDMFKKADIAMYKAKDDPDKQYCVYCSE